MGHARGHHRPRHSQAAIWQLLPGLAARTRRRAEKAFISVVADCYLAGESTRRVDKLVKQLGIEGISKSQVSKLARELDAIVEAFRSRPLDGAPSIASSFSDEATSSPSCAPTSRRDGHRSHRALDMNPDSRHLPANQGDFQGRVWIRDVLGGLIHEYERAA